MLRQVTLSSRDVDAQFLYRSPLNWHCRVHFHSILTNRLLMTFEKVTGAYVDRK